MLPGATAAAAPMAPRSPAERVAFDVRKRRADFPALRERVHGRPLVYLDNASTTHKPRVVLDAIRGHYAHANANVRRGIHTLGERATHAYEGARARVQRFVNASAASEIIFTRGTTEAL